MGIYSNVTIIYHLLKIQIKSKTFELYEDFSAIFKNSKKKNKNTSLDHSYDHDNQSLL